MPYVVRKRKGKKCVYKKKKNGKPGKKVGCTKKSIKKYLAALHINANESLEEKTMKISKQKLERIIKEEVAREMRMRKRKRLSEAMSDEDTERINREMGYDAEETGVEYEKELDELNILGQQIADGFKKNPPDLDFLSIRGSKPVDLLGSGPHNDAGARSNFVHVMKVAGVPREDTQKILDSKVLDATKQDVNPEHIRMIFAVLAQLKYNSNENQ